MRTLPSKRLDLNPIEELDELFERGEVDRLLFSKVSANPEAYYGRFERIKKNGKKRVIEPPKPLLRRWQRFFLEKLYGRVTFPRFVHGGVPNHSIFTHAAKHVGRAMVATLDLTDFFPSVTTSQVLYALNIAKITGPAADALLPMLTLRGALPQGAPTSPMLANLAFAGTDREFSRFCKMHDLFYSRYVDDIAISGSVSFKEFRGFFESIISRAGFKVSADKVHFQSRNEPQVITGLIVNDRMRPSRDFIQELKECIVDCLEVGAAQVADMDGVTVAKLKSRLNGQISHIAQSDAALAEKIRRRMYGIDW